MIWGNRILSINNTTIEMQRVWMFIKCLLPCKRLLELLEGLQCLHARVVTFQVVNFVEVWAQSKKQELQERMMKITSCTLGIILNWWYCRSSRRLTAIYARYLIYLRRKSTYTHTYTHVHTVKMKYPSWNSCYTLFSNCFLLPLPCMLHAVFG